MVVAFRRVSGEAAPVAVKRGCHYPRPRNKLETKSDARRATNIAGLADYARTEIPATGQCVLANERQMGSRERRAGDRDIDRENNPASTRKHRSRFCSASIKLIVGVDVNPRGEKVASSRVHECTCIALMRLLNSAAHGEGGTMPFKYSEKAGT